MLARAICRQWAFSAQDILGSLRKGIWQSFFRNWRLQIFSNVLQRAETLYVLAPIALRTPSTMSSIFLELTSEKFTCSSYFLFVQLHFSFLFCNCTWAVPVNVHLTIYLNNCTLTPALQHSSATAPSSPNLHSAIAMIMSSDSSRILSLFESRIALRNVSLRRITFASAIWDLAVQPLLQT